MAIQKQTARSLSDKSFTAEAYDLYRRMEKRTDVIIRKIIGFNTSCDWDDYRQEAYFACLEALNRYRQPTNMTLETFAFWYISNRLARMADTGDVCFTVVNGDGNEVGRLTNSSWRKLKTSLEKQGCHGEFTKCCFLFSELHDWWKEVVSEPCDMTSRYAQNTSAQK